MNKKLVYVDVSSHSAVVVCTICDRQWGAVDKEEGYRMATTHRVGHIQERQERSVMDECQEEGCTKPARYKRYGPQCDMHYVRTSKERKVS